MWGFRYKYRPGETIKPQANVAPILLLVPVSIAIGVPIMIYMMFLSYIMGTTSHPGDHALVTEAPVVVENNDTDAPAPSE